MCLAAKYGRDRATRFGVIRCSTEALLAVEGPRERHDHLGAWICPQKFASPKSENSLSNMAGRSTESRDRTTSSSRKAKRTSGSRSIGTGSSRSTSGKSKRGPANRSAAAKRAYLSRPFEPKLLVRAKELAAQYRVVIQSEPDVGYFGFTVELPLVMGEGKTVEACVADVLEAAAEAIATTLEHGGTPPVPAREGKRDQQINIRLSADEKLRLEELARRDGYRTVSDFIRATALGAA